MNDKRQRLDRSVKLHIEELVLDGFLPQDRWRIARAIELELMRLLSQDDLPSLLARGGVTPELDGGSFHMRTGSTPETTGTQVAQNLHGGLNR